jgi:hypothetical protein
MTESEATAYAAQITPAYPIDVEEMDGSYLARPVDFNYMGSRAASAAQATSDVRHMIFQTVKSRLIKGLDFPEPSRAL